MTIQTPPPAAPSTPPDEPSRSDQPAIFVSKADAFLAWFKELRASMFDFVSWWPTFKGELDGTIATINTGTGIGLRYIFSATTTDADPGAGVLRLSNATQNLATVVRMDLVDANGVNAQPVIDLFDDSSSVNKGTLKLQHATDPTKFLILNVTAVAAPAGYRDVTASVVASSAASPFVDGDQLLVSFVRNGDIATGTVSSTDVQKQQYTAFTTGGTGTAYTLTPTPALTAYAAGESFSITFHAASGAAPTLNVSGLGATVNLVKQLADGTYANVAAGDIPINHRSRVTLLSPTQALVERFPALGRLIGVQRFTATGPYTASPGTNSVVVELQGAGAAGGGAANTAAGQNGAGSGGGAGGYAKSRFTNGFNNLTVTIGLGGAGVAGANGGAGGTTSFGALFSATGGNGGSAGPAIATGTVTFVAGGAAGAGSGGNLVNAAGQPGSNSLYASTVALSGAGGSSSFGGGAPSLTGTSGGTAASSPGAGGSGGSTSPTSGTSAAGGRGADGVALIWEYA